MTATAGVLGQSQAKPLAALVEAVSESRHGLPHLLEAARNGDADAFAAIIQMFQAPTYQFIARMVRRPAVAEDLAQDVFIRLWRHLGEIDSVSLLPAWLRRVAANAVIDHWRKEESRDRRLQVLREHPIARRVVRPSGRMESREMADVVQAGLDALPAKLRTVLLLRTLEGLSYEEMADVLGLSVNAVRSRLFRARQDLHEILKHKKAADYLADMYRSADAEGSD